MSATIGLFFVIIKINIYKFIFKTLEWAKRAYMEKFLHAHFHQQGIGIDIVLPYAWVLLVHLFQPLLQL